MKDGIEKSLGAHLVHAARLHRARSAQLLRDLGLFPGQERVLQTLAAGHRMSMGDLAATLKVRPPTISKTIGRLAAQGLVTRLGSEADARVVDVMLTEPGEERAALILGIWGQIEDEMTDGLDGKERRRLRKLLRRAARNLTHAVGAEPAGIEPADVDPPDEDEDV
jgi:DNA-binding MarR family transcriptional regulator